MDPPSASEKLPSTYSFSVSPSRSALHQSLSFPIEGDFLEDVDIASSTSFVIEGEQEQKEEPSDATAKPLSAPDGSHCCKILARSLSFSIFPTWACVPTASIPLLTSAPPAPEIFLEHLVADTSLSIRVANNSCFSLKFLNCFAEVQASPCWNYERSQMLLQISFAPCLLQIWNIFLRFSTLSASSLLLPCYIDVARPPGNHTKQSSDSFLPLHSL